LHELRVQARIAEISTDLFPTCVCYFRLLARGVSPCGTRQGAGLLCTHARRFGMARHYRSGPTSSPGPVVARSGLRGGAWWPPWWRVVASVVAPLVASVVVLVGPVVAPLVALVGPVVATLSLPASLACPSGCALCFWHVHTGRTGGHVDADLVASIQAGRTAPFATRLVGCAGCVDAGRAPFARWCGPWLPGCTLADHPSRFVRVLDTRLCAVSLLAWVVLGLLGVSFRAGR